MKTRPQSFFWIVASTAIFAAGWLTARITHVDSVIADSHEILPGSRTPDVLTEPSRGALLNQALSRADTLDRETAIGRLILEMSVADLEAALDDLLRRSQDPVVARTLDMLWQRFGELDGQRALRRAEKLTHFKDRTSAIDLVLRGIAWSDPDAAWKEGLENRNLVPVADILREKGEVDFLFRRLAELPEGLVKGRVTGSVAVRLARYEPEALLPLIDSIPQGDASRNIFLMALGSRLAQIDPANAVGWATSLEVAEAGQVLNLALGVWIERDPEASAAWLLNQGARSELDQRRIQNAVRLASRQPAVSLQLAEQLTDPSTRARLPEHVIRVTAAQNPSDAALLAEVLTDPSARQRVFTIVINAWKRRDSEAAGNYVRTSPNLSQEERASLEQVLVSPPPSSGR